MQSQGQKIPKTTAECVVVKIKLENHVEQHIEGQLMLD